MKLYEGWEEYGNYKLKINKFIRNGKNRGSARNEVFWEQNFSVLDLESGEELSDEKEKVHGVVLFVGE